MTISHLVGSEKTDAIECYATTMLPRIPSNSPRHAKVTIASATIPSTIAAPYHYPLHDFLQGASRCLCEREITLPISNCSVGIISITIITQDRVYHIQAALHDLYMPRKILVRESLLQKNERYLYFLPDLLNGIPKIIEGLHGPFRIRLFPITRCFPPKQGDNRMTSAPIISGTYLGEIASGGIHDPLPPFEPFPAGFFVTGWDAGSCDVPTGTASSGASRCLQTLKTSKLSAK